MWFERGLDAPQSDYADVQHFALQLAQPGDILVEVGSFVGESTAYLIDRIRESGKQLKVYSVDLWDIREMCADGGHGMDQRMNDHGLTPRLWQARYGPRCMLTEFYRNLAYAGRDQLLTGAIVSRSTEAASLFADGSVHFCFLDAGHSYENLTGDLNAWWLKMRQPSCVFAGHDWFSGEQVRKAVIDFSQQKGLSLVVTGSSWLLALPDSPILGMVQRPPWMDEAEKAQREQAAVEEAAKAAAATAPAVSP